MRKILIFCSNLHGGGGAAVATSFISSLTNLELGGLSIDLMLSERVYENLETIGVDLKIFNNVIVSNAYGIRALWHRDILYVQKYDVVFTIFGPLYSLRKVGRKQIVGFAQPSIIYPERIKYFERSVVRRCLFHLKYKIQEFFFKRDDCIVVELEHVKDRLLKKNLFVDSDIRVIHSTFDDIFLHKRMWRLVNFPSYKGIKLGLISRNYAHKNIKIFPRVREILRSRFKLECEFYVTFSKDEWLKCSREFRDNVINVGPLSLSQCPTFYEKMDGIVFPTLLECFSAVPIEAMLMKRKLFASDLPFIRDCANEFAYYFDPLCCEDIARCIYDGLNDEASRRLGEARDHAMRFGGAERRAAEYVSLIHEVSLNVNRTS